MKVRPRKSVFILLAIALALLLMPQAEPASAATFTVNSTVDAIDANPGDGVCATATLRDCTLRAAVMEANALPGADTITFSARAATLAEDFEFRYLVERSIEAAEGTSDLVSVGGRCGDQNADGTVDVLDAIIDMQIIVGLIDATEAQMFLSDVVRDGQINAFDVILTLQHIVGLTEITGCGVAADLRVSKSDDVDPVTAGGRLIYTVQVNNAGPSDAQDVVVTDILPASVSLVSTSGCAEDPSGVPTCSLGTIPPGGSAQFTITVDVNAGASGAITNDASVDSSTNDPSPDNNSGSEDTNVLALTELAKPTFSLISLYDKLLDIDSSGNLIPELATAWRVSPDETTYTFDLRQNVQFHDGTLLSAAAVKFNMEENVVIFPGFVRKSQLDKGAISQANVIDDLTLQVVLPSPDSAFLQTLAGLDGMMVSPSASDGGPVGAGPFKFVNLTPFERLDLQAFSNYWAGQPQVSSLRFFFLPDEATRVAALRVGQIQAMAGGKNPGNYDILSQSGFLMCGIPTDFQAVAPAATGFECLPGGAMRFENVSGLGNLRVGVPNFEDGPTSPFAWADLLVSKSDDVDPVAAGETLTYTVQVNNAGPSDAHDVVVTDTLPTGVAFLSTSGCAEDPNGVPTCSLGTIPPGDSAQFTITVDVDEATAGVITNNVSVGSSTDDFNPNNNSDSENTNVDPPPRPELTKESFPLISLYDKLVDIDASGNLVPELATWTISPDGTRYTFTLRQNLQFHDGTSLTASSVKFNMEKTVAIFPAFVRTSLLKKGIISSVRVICFGRCPPILLTFEVVLPSPDPDFLQKLAGMDGMIVAPTASDAEPVGAGPFKFVNLTPFERLDLQAFSNYWAGQPRVSSLRFLQLAEEATRWAALVTGETQAMTGGGSPSRYDDLTQRGFILCGNPTDFQAVSPSATGFECFPDGALRFEKVSGLSTLRVGVPNFDDGPG